VNVGLRACPGRARARASRPENKKNGRDSMGQYHVVVNLDRREFVHPYKLGCGYKLLEQLTSPGGPGDALLLLLACSNGRGGGDAPEHPRVGSWAGDRIAVVGDYAEDTDLAPEHRASTIWDRCRPRHKVEQAAAGKYGAAEKARAREALELGLYRDITDELVPLLEQTCDVEIADGDGWRHKEVHGGSGPRLCPDVLIVAKPREPR